MGLRTVFTLCTLFLAAGSGAQNLVYNPGLEESAECPLTGNYDFFYKEPCKFWTSPKTGTPDYYHAGCGFAGSATTTNNSVPHNGQAFAGFYAYGNFNSGSQKFYNREYIQGKLKTSLKPGHYYSVSFWVKPVNADAAGISAAIKQIGIHFSDVQLSTGDDYLISVIPQVENNNGPLNDMQKWTLVSGCFRADNPALFFTLGNFRPDEETEMVPLAGAKNTRHAYYLIDDISVTEVLESALFDNREVQYCRGDSAELHIAAAIPDSFEIYWNKIPGGISQTIYKPGAYVVTVSDGNYCFISDTITAIETQCATCHFYLPEAITPDENQWNDKFSLVSDCSPRIIRLQVFNRWGECMFDETSSNPEWDGKYNGEYVPGGVYVYAMDVFYEEKGITLRKRLNGALTVLR